MSRSSSRDAIVRFRQGVAVARAGNQLVLEHRGALLHRSVVSDPVMRIAVKLLGGLPRPVLEEEAKAPAIANALSVWRTSDLIQEYDDVGQLESASRLQKLFHRGGWSGAISLLESTRSEGVFCAQTGVAKAAGPSIPFRASAATPSAGPASAAERALRKFSEHWSTRVLSVSSGPDDGEAARDVAMSITSGDIRSWMPVLYRSGLHIGHVVLLAHDAVPRSPYDFVHRQLSTGLVTREIEAELQSDGFGYLAHTWLSPEAQSRFGSAPVVAAIAVEEAHGHRC